MNLTAHLPVPVRLPALAAHQNKRVVYALFVSTASAVSIGVIAAVAYASGHLLVVPSLGAPSTARPGPPRSSSAWAS
jgi:hypothetical protein